MIRLAIGFRVPGIDFQASDGEPVHLVASVVSPLNAASHHLGVLARLATLLRRKEPLARIGDMHDPLDVVAFLQREDERFEAELAQRRAGATRPHSTREGSILGTLQSTTPGG